MVDKGGTREKKEHDVLVGHRNRVEKWEWQANGMTGSGDFSQRGGGGCCRPGRLVDVEGDPLGVTGPLLPRDNQEYRSPSEDSGLGADMPRTRSRRFRNCTFCHLYAPPIKLPLLSLSLLNEKMQNSFLSICETLSDNDTVRSRCFCYPTWGKLLFQ